MNGEEINNVVLKELKSINLEKANNIRNLKPQPGLEVYPTPEILPYVEEEEGCTGCTEGEPCEDCGGNKKLDEGKNLVVNVNTGATEESIKQADEKRKKKALWIGLALLLIIVGIILFLRKK